MAASQVSMPSRPGPVNPAPDTVGGVAAATGQLRHGALNHAFIHAKNGENLSAAALSAAHTFQSFGQAASVQVVAR